MESKRKPYTELGILLDSDPQAAAERIKALLAETRGNASQAARNEGISYATLLRYFARLRKAGYPVRAEGKRGRAGHENVPPAERKKHALAVHRAMRAHRDDLTHREEEILSGKYPTQGEPKSCVQLAADLKISRQAVQKIESRALAKIGLSDG